MKSCGDVGIDEGNVGKQKWLAFISKSEISYWRGHLAYDHYAMKADYVILSRTLLLAKIYTRAELRFPLKVVVKDIMLKFN